MDWTAAASVASVLGTITLGVLTFIRGSKADDALNKANTIEATFTAQRDFIDNLQEDIKSTREHVRVQRDELMKCEQACRECRSNLAGARLIISAQEVEIENLKAVVGEHEMTITNHEKSLNQIRRRSDQTSPRRAFEERRTDDDAG